MRRITPTLLFGFILCFTQPYVEAQNTGGVFPPGVNAGHEAIQYRASFLDDNNGLAQRFHYERSIDSDYMWRIVGQVRKTASSDTVFDYVQGELFWQLSEDGQPWQTGLRFDLRLRDGDRPGTIGVNWMNQYQLSNGWQARLLGLTTLDFGSNARDGIGLQTRANLWQTTPNRTQYGLELFSSYGTTSDFADFDEQRHTLGPFAVIPVGRNGWSVFAGALFGLNDASPDTDLRLWLTKIL